MYLEYYEFLLSELCGVDGTPNLIVYLKFCIFFFNHLLESSISPLFIKKSSSPTYFSTLNTNLLTNDKNYLAHSKCINRDKCSALRNCCSSETFHRSSSNGKSRERNVNYYNLKKKKKKMGLHTYS